MQVWSSLEPPNPGDWTTTLWGPFAPPPFGHTYSGFHPPFLAVLVLVLWVWNSTGPPSARPPSAGPPSAGPPKISLFFHSQATISLCEAPAAPRPPGLHTTAREPKRAHFRVPAFKNTTKIPREDTRETQKERNGGGKEKKSAKFWAPPPPGPHLPGPHPSMPHPSGPHPSGVCSSMLCFFILLFFFFLKKKAKRLKHQVGLAKVGQLRLA